MTECVLTHFVVWTHSVQSHSNCLIKDTIVMHVTCKLFNGFGLKKNCRLQVRNDHIIDLTVNHEAKYPARTVQTLIYLITQHSVSVWYSIVGVKTQ